MRDELPRRADGRVCFTPPGGLTLWPQVDRWIDRDWSHWLTQRGYEPDEITNYLDNDRYAYGVGFLPNGERATPHTACEKGVTWLYKPTPKGVTLHETRTSGVSNILWGGAQGGTKSQSARWEAISECLFTERDHYRAIIVRRELEELRRTHLDRIDLEAYKIGMAIGDPKAIKVTSQPPCATFQKTGAKIIFGHANNPGDELKYLSEDYDLFVGDEATSLLWSQIVGIAGRLRNDPKLNRVARMILTTNPGGPSHQECVDHFITKTVSAEQNALYNPADYQFIKSLLYDNMYLMNADGMFTTYEKRLYAYREDRRRQLLEGDWTAIVNQFFQDFDPIRHVRAMA